MAEFTLPNLGENIAQGDVLTVLVKVGDRIALEQTVLELETDKATIEVPSSVEGVVSKILVKAGDKVKPGQAVLVVQDVSASSASSADGGNGSASSASSAAQDGSASSASSAADGNGAGAQPADKEAPKAEAKQDSTQEAKPEAKEESKKAAKPEPKDEPAKGEPEPKKGESPPDAEQAGASAPTEKQEDPPADEEAEPPAPAKGKDERRASVVDIRGRQPSTQPAAPVVMPAATQASQAPAGPAPPASPAVRRVAREIGVDIAQVTGTGADGRITDADVKAFARHVLSSLGGGAVQPATGRPAAPGPSLPDFTKWGEIERKPMTGIRRKTAEHLSHAWNAIPHVTQFDKADMTVLEQVRPKFAAEAERLGGKLTVTAVVTKIIASAVKQFPQFNASIDLATESIIYKKYVHIGIAVDTERGLLVPVVRNADQKNIMQIAVDIHQLAEKARARKLSLDEMSGGSMSITNLGGIGGTAFTPIINWPEVAILGISRGAIEPVWKDGKVEPRQTLPLSLSYDHRVIDGADAIRFLRWVVDAIEQPFALLLRG